MSILFEPLGEVDGRRKELRSVRRGSDRRGGGGDRGGGGGSRGRLGLLDVMVVNFGTGDRVDLNKCKCKNIEKNEEQEGSVWDVPTLHTKIYKKKAMNAATHNIDLG